MFCKTPYGYKTLPGNGIAYNTVCFPWLELKTVVIG